MTTTSISNAYGGSGRGGSGSGGREQDDSDGSVKYAAADVLSLFVRYAVTQAVRDRRRLLLVEWTNAQETRTKRAAPAAVAEEKETASEQRIATDDDGGGDDCVHGNAGGDAHGKWQEQGQQRERENAK